MQALYYGLFINLILAFFNLLPIPPLDGSHVVAHMLPSDLAFRYRRLGQHGIMLLMGIMFLFPGAFRVILWPVYFLAGLVEEWEAETLRAVWVRE